jgi:hypothetical protein
MGDRGGGDRQEVVNINEKKGASFKDRVKGGYQDATGQRVASYGLPAYGGYQRTGPEEMVAEGKAISRFTAKDASAVEASKIAKTFGLSEQQRQATFNQQALAAARREQRDRYGPGDDPTIYREEKRKKAEEEAAAAAAAAAAEEEKTAATTTGADTTATTTSTTTTAADTTQTDYSKLLADMQTKYDTQLAAFQSEMDAATQQQTDQLTKLAEATTAHKKKLKKSGRKFGRLSLLFNSELGIPKTTTLGG